MNTRGFAIRSAASRQRGFSLVEVLISIIILSFGMLGMVGMQAAALQSNREARLQSVAYGLARELAEMMQANKDVALSGSYMVDFPPAPATSAASYCMNVGSTGCAAAGTDALVKQAAIAKAQLTEWHSRVDAELPGAKVKVCMDDVPFDASGLPNWGCTINAAASSGAAYVKIGWTQGSTNRAAGAASAFVRTTDTGSRPALVFAVIAGNG